MDHAAGSMDPAGLARALELVRGRHTAAQLYVARAGRVMLDEAVDCPPEGLFWIFSASKPVIAMLVHLLAERGELALDDRVAAHWPAFGQHGKDAITIRQVLRHRSGLTTARGALPDSLAMINWARSVRDIEQASPRFPPGTVPAYQFLSYGFILGELVRRVTGLPVPEFLRTELLDPLRLTDLHLGLPDELWHRHVPIRAGYAAGRGAQYFLNRRTTRRAVIPAAGISTTARALGRFYQVLLDDGALDGVTVLAPKTITAARQESSDNETDRFVRLPIRWAQGFQLGGPGPDPTRHRPMGRHSSRETFGHNGSNCCLAWADPTRGLVFVYLTSLLLPGHEGARHLSELCDTIIDACD